MKISLHKLSFHELLVIFGDVLDELKKRGIVRSQNNPVADYAEWLVSKAFGLNLQSNSNSSFDAIDSKGIKYQIKGRRLHPFNKSRQLGVIRNLKDKKFDYLIGIIFAKDFSVLEAYKIPHCLVERCSHFSEHQNGHILILRGNILTTKGVKRIDRKLSSYVANNSIAI